MHGRAVPAGEQAQPLPTRCAPRRVTLYWAPKQSAEMPSAAEFVQVGFVSVVFLVCSHVWGLACVLWSHRCPPVLAL